MGDYMTIVSDNTGGDVAYAATFNLEEDIYYVRVAPGIAPTPTPTPPPHADTDPNPPRPLRRRRHHLLPPHRSAHMPIFR